MTRRRRDTRLESEGAEFLVLGQRLVAGIEAHKAYTRYPGYDLITANPDRDRTCRIQVKNRWATDYDGSFLIKNFGCDFVVHVALNRGYSFRRRGQEGACSHPRSGSSLQRSSRAPSQRAVRGARGSCATFPSTTSMKRLGA